MRLLGLDLSTRVGWAVFAHAGAIPKLGTFVLPKTFIPEDYAGRTLPLRFWLREMIAVHRPDVIAFESPFIPMGQPTGGGFTTTQHALRLQISLASEVETTAKECAVGQIREVATSSAKVALAGTSRLGDRKKQAMVIAAIERGWPCADDHQADAGAVGLVVYDDLGG